MSTQGYRKGNANVNRLAMQGLKYPTERDADAQTFPQDMVTFIQALKEVGYSTHNRSRESLWNGKSR